MQCFDCCGERRRRTKRRRGGGWGASIYADLRAMLWWRSCVQQARTIKRLGFVAMATAASTCTIEATTSMAGRLTATWMVAGKQMKRYTFSCLLVKVYKYTMWRMKLQHITAPIRTSWESGAIESTRKKLCLLCIIFVLIASSSSLPSPSFSFVSFLFSLLLLMTFATGTHQKMRTRKTSAVTRLTAMMRTMHCRLRALSVRRPSQSRWNHFPLSSLKFFWLVPQVCGSDACWWDAPYWLMDWCVF